MLKAIKNISSLVTVNANGSLYKAGADMQEIGEIKNGAIIFDENIIWVGSTENFESIEKKNQYKIGKIIDATNKTILPGFVDSHTHIVFAGNRSDEFARRLRGASYQEIAAEGGGILTTMKATRTASIDELVENGLRLIKSAISYGTTAFEIKSGYGLNLESEIKMLQAIDVLKKKLPVHISSTFLGAHDFPPEFKNERNKYIDIVKNEMIPTIAEMKIAEYCDAFIDYGYYTLHEGEEILNTARDYGLKLKVHCDELADFGAASLVANLGAISADHLLFISDTGIKDIISSHTVATLLPGTAYFIRMQYAPARKLIDRGAIVALATDCNPGSCFTENLQMILSLAAINMKMTAEECISAVTLNGAAAINQSHIMGSLEPGKNANFLIANVPSFTDLFYHFGINHISEVWVKGEVVHENQL